MHLKVFLKLKKLSLLGQYIKKTKKNNKKKTKNPKKPQWAVFFFKPGFFPTPAW
jgi:hypothetical protein